MTHLFALLANVLMALVILIYFNQVRSGTSTPNPSTWMLWSAVGIINAVTYFFVVDGDLWQAGYTIVMAVGISMICLYAFWHGKFGPLGTVERLALTTAAMVIVIWQWTADPVLANVSLQAVFIISFIPTIRGLLNGELREKGLPWYTAVASYLCSIVSIVTSDDFVIAALAFPVINGILGNGSVAVIVFRQTRRDELPTPKNP